ncbi:hypothetical protein [Pseudomonas abieticivorans]|uniref:hypothetical protein n=1 Tax=Pseudomonas abieticivorans TaxID=2931382 RepID=UPI0020BE7A65|nr:hypothetical protein [Pseudomonas sp. PIA16]
MKPSLKADSSLVLPLTVDPIITVEPWPFIAPGQRLWLQVSGRANGVAVTLPVVLGTGVLPAETSVGLYKPANRSWFNDLDNNSDVIITLKVNMDGQPTSPENSALVFPASDPIHITRNDRVLGRVAIPKAYNSTATQLYLRMGDLYNDDFLEVQLPLATSQASDRYKLIWKGHVTWESDLLPVISPGVKVVQVLRREFVDIIGSTAEVSYQVVDANGTIHPSATTLVSVDAYPGFVLGAPRISDRNVTVQYNGQSSRHTVQVTALGNSVWRSSIEPMPDNPNHWLTVSLGTAWYNENIGRLVSINYSMARNDGSAPQLMFSRYLRLTLR